MSSEEARLGPVRAAQLQSRRDREVSLHNEKLENVMGHQYPNADKSEREYAAFNDPDYMLGGRRSRRYRRTRTRRTRRTRRYRR